MVLQKISLLAAAICLSCSAIAQEISPEHIAAYERFLQSFDSDDARDRNSTCFAEQVTTANSATWGQASPLLYCLDAMRDPDFPGTDFDQTTFRLLCEQLFSDRLNAQQFDMILSPRSCEHNPNRLAEPVLSRNELNCALEPYCDEMTKGFPESRDSCLRQYGRCADAPRGLTLHQRDQCWFWRHDLVKFAAPSIGLGVGGGCRQTSLAPTAHSETPMPGTWQEEVAQDAAADSPDEFNMGGLDF